MMNRLLILLLVPCHGSGRDAEVSFIFVLCLAKEVRFAGETEDDEHCTVL